MAAVALVSLILLIQYIVFQMNVGTQRVRHSIKAPACSGHEMFDRAYRVQMNTLEQLIITLPAMWLCAFYFQPPVVAAGLGLMFFIGRILYRATYMADPEKRGPGMIIGFFANAAMIVLAAWGAVGML